MSGNDVKELKETIKFYIPKIQNNVTIVTPKDIGQDFMHHISVKRFKDMVPNISKRAGASEDNLLPRVHVAPTLTGCMQGYAGIHAHQLNDLVINGDGSIYKGFIHIYKIPFKACLKPNKRLVYDANETGEHWLVTYNKNTVVFPSSVVGFIVPINLKVTPLVDKSTISTSQLAICVKDKDGIILDSKTTLSKGYWLLDFISDHSKPKDITENITEITKEEYEKLTSTKIATESLVEEPHYTKW
jgi:hypothetical protein